VPDDVRARIDEIVPTGLTRRRGKQAYDEIHTRDSGGRICVELDQSELISLSFLDEIIFSADRDGMLGRVVFVTRNPDYVRKLGRVSHIRELEVRRLVDGKPEAVDPDPGPQITVAPPGARPPDGID